MYQSKNSDSFCETIFSGKGFAKLRLFIFLKFGGVSGLGLARKNSNSKIQNGSLGLM
jgi:hypothetical protein